jgi:hypothetical protein
MTVFIKNIENNLTDISCAFLDIKESTERRKCTRIPFIEDVIIDGTKHSTTLDICEEGLYIASLLPLMKDTVVEITIPANEKRIKLKAQVQFHEPGIGMGLKFVDLRDDKRMRIRDLIESIKKQNK